MSETKTLQGPLTEADVRSLKAGDEVTLMFPMETRVVHRVIGEMPFKLTLRGANVVEIDPKGKAYQLYAHQPKGKLVRKKRFIPEKQEIVW